MIRMAVANLFSRKLRTALTILGVVIGTTSIIVMLSLGYGMTSMMERQISGWGDLTILNVYSGYDERARKPKELTDQSIRDLEELPHVQAVMPNRRFSIRLKAKHFDPAYSNVLGMTLKEMEAFGLEIEEGRMLKQGDDSSVAIMGSDVVESFWPTHRPPAGAEPKKLDPLRSKIEIHTEDINWNTGESKTEYLQDIKVVGVLKPQTDREMNQAIYMDVDSFEKLKKDYESKSNPDGEKEQQNKKKTYNNLRLKVDNIDYVKEVSDAIKDMGYDSWGMQSMIDDARQEFKVVQAIFGGIGGISLIVASIGIANTMVMSIYERTREIGVMKVIGASIQDIKKLFLTEAAFIGVLGGVVGLLLSTLLSFALNSLGGQFVSNSMGMGPDGAPPQISIIPWWLYIVALTFGALIGLLSGYFPARKAMALSAIDAIKSE
ncbi:MAG: ABC transporter permease [Tissierellia bacterium]|nr:ABC transporter permease [Tissierellia bacterium]